PQLIAQVPGETGARHHQRDLRPPAQRPRHREQSVFEGFEAFDARQTHRLQQLAGSRALHRERRDLLGDLADLDVKAERGGREPVELSLRGAYTVFVVGHAKDGAVIDQMALVVAPHRVRDPPRPRLAQVAGHQAIEEAQSVGTGDAVLDHRSQVVERARVTDREVLLLDAGEYVDGGVAAPWHEAVQLARRAGALVERRLQQRLAVVRLAHGEHFRRPRA